VYYGTSPGTYLQPLGSGISTGKATTYTTTGLVRGQTYFFVVTAVDSAANESQFSNEASKLIE
jgi:fibronectin type 3 domain-containing protein